MSNSIFLVNKYNHFFEIKNADLLHVEMFEECKIFKCREYMYYHLIENKGFLRDEIEEMDLIVQYSEQHDEWLISDGCFCFDCSDIGEMYDTVNELEL